MRFPNFSDREVDMQTVIGEILSKEEELIKVTFSAPEKEAEFVRILLRPVELKKRRLAGGTFCRDESVSSQSQTGRIERLSFGHGTPIRTNYPYHERGNGQLCQEGRAV